MKKYKLGLLISSIVLVTACGGGGNDSSEYSSSSNNAQKPIENTVPVANAGNKQNLTLGDLVTLDGSQSIDKDQNQLTYKWTFKEKPTQSSVTLSDDKLVNPTFKPDIIGQYILELVVSDGLSQSEPSLVEINVVQGNAAPVAIIAELPKEIAVGSKYIFDGKQSTDNDNDSLNYQWSIEEKPTNSLAQLSQAQSSEPSIIFDQIGSYTIALVVNDGHLNSTKVTKVINVTRGNSVPIANAGEKQLSKVGENIVLDGSQSSDADNDKLSYQWSINSKPSGSQASLQNANSVRPSFQADVEGTYVFSLVVSDGYTSSQPSNVSLEVQAQPKLVLMGTDSFWGTTVYPFPHTINTSFQVSSSCIGNGCANTVELAKYTLEAKGQNFTITDLAVTTSNGNYPASFGGLNNNQVIQAGEKVNFSLVLTKTQSNQVSVQYSFKVKETGQTFSYSASGSTN